MGRSATWSSACAGEQALGQSKCHGKERTMEMKSRLTSVLVFGFAVAALAQQSTPPPVKTADSGPTLASTMQFIQEKLSEQGQVVWAETVSVQPGLVHRLFVTVSDVMADPAACTLYTTETVDSNVYVEPGKIVRMGGKPVVADDLRTHTVETDTVSFKQVEKITVERWQDVKAQGFAEASHPEITVTVTPPVFYLEMRASNPVFSGHVSTSKGNNAPVEQDGTSKMIGHTFRDEDTANHVAKAMTHAMELCGGGVTKKELF